MSVPQLIYEMFMSPGTPQGGYERMAAAFGHAMIGVLLTAALLGARPRRPWLVSGLSLAIYLPWEIGQVLIAGSSLTDSAIDAGAVLAGALIAASLWTRRLPLVLVLAPVLVLLGRAIPEKQRGGDE
ncbi:MAG: hypothetical protein MEQ74_00995 [Paracoccus sp.]|nr:hypothetical protein [Paracoccus sp. (in: a-proteobacteria)]